MDRRLGMMIGLVAALAAGGLVIARQKRRDAPRAERTPTVEIDRAYTCECGARYGVSGAGRHLVFWPADGTPADAILEGHCPACERPWPAEDALTAA